MTTTSVRWCSIGDTITTVTPRGGGLNLSVECDSPEMQQQANALIATGRWRVSRCGTCQKLVEQCECE